ncbi:hypothetical protein [Crossiella sp. CA198]|uniref:hypothetical protein n=1 Tax=Crossiella sp. CA198 TaxID=3455607 RepID=UPI003F8D233E
MLAVRRQRAIEAGLGLQAETAADVRYDAAEKRITELRTKAADQLGPDKAPVRLNGLDALARLAESNADHRQMIVDVLCAYLRMPYPAPPQDEPPTPDPRDPCSFGCPG